ncbi:TPA: uracil-DNA glycosylase [Patescibacteria group bacterium]|uniref:Type-4 uracil-DNA glycosylase n=2 Tax=Bacteria division Kazan-3B-28 TaxID=1798534 RepID=A0A0G1X884_UNCK3|nr:MAG: phage SPO1 DNA polymerase-related protein, DNA polymerase bacteriophage-type [candidate division Kazan bacterium GW2011_GWA1_50_15]KKW25789.1 MAG: Phage SPO1 DNA polymerase-related protein [candidate division Kazan bacterium GW2011_GWC1_52_13]KKW27196.1 MAG: Phage SPO1 DNA polymerase-related protein [candidate division Kazan bacterium GW2011_GWB1_52_7]HCL47630.1 uracil-DNA glycosylase [Patescibacteria group bacterium]HCR42486.1 uracil-DNA glycosylase [Patescibacteria group bacterium]
MADKQQEFVQLVGEIKAHHCSLRAGCLQAVPGDGNIDSPVVFIGEGPGKVEDELGRPFVGPAGKLLEEALSGIGWSRSDVYITNVVKCRPPENRDPLPAEVEEHKPFLERELALIKPKLIVLLGRHALHWFLPAEKISQIRGTAKRRGEQVFFITYHPAAALYDPKLKTTLMSDFKKIPTLLVTLDQLSSPVSPPLPSQPSIF